MDSFMSNLMVHQVAQNPTVAPLDEGYGIEVEVEGYDKEHNGRLDARSLAKHWTMVADGSLRNNGIEFVSKFLAPAMVERAVRHLYGRTRSKWNPSIRTGVHVHANMLGRSFEEVRRVLAYYALVEPVLFRFAGKYREENIYCVPWYRAPDEAHNAADGVMNDYGKLRDACKYSALNVLPLLNYGTIEFRHAETFDSADATLGWILLCRSISNSYDYPDPLHLYAQKGIAGVLRAVFGDVLPHMGLSMEDAEQLVDESGSAEVALLFQPCMYKAGPWGSPGTFVTSGETPTRGSFRRIPDEHPLFDGGLELRPSDEEQPEELESEDEPEQQDDEPEEDQ